MYMHAYVYIYTREVGSGKVTIYIYIMTYQKLNGEPIINQPEQIADFLRVFRWVIPGGQGTSAHLSLPSCT